jgi:hypothetical protein
MNELLIKVPESEFRALLDRDKVVAATRWTGPIWKDGFAS